jgi:hypothetical protein
MRTMSQTEPLSLIRTAQISRRSSPTHLMSLNKTLGYYKKREAGSRERPEVNSEWIDQNLKYMEIFWHNSTTVTTENLFNVVDLSDRLCTRAVTGVITTWVREARSQLKPAYDILDEAWTEEAKLGNSFRRFYKAKIQRDKKKGVYIDAGMFSKGAIVAPSLRPRMFTRPQAVHPDILELTTRIGVGLLQCAEFEQQ